MLSLLISQTPLIDTAVNATSDPLVNWALGALVAAIMAVSGVAIFLYKDKSKQDMIHKKDMKELYDNFNTVINSVNESLIIIKERLK